MKRFMAALAVACVALTMAGSAASAHTGYTERLRLFFADTGSVQWQSYKDDTGAFVKDSPLDTNHARLKINVPEQTGDDYAGVYANNTSLAGRLLGDVRNVSFDFLLGPGDTGGGVRFSIPIDENGDSVTDNFLFAAARDCAEPITASNWQRADFTGRNSLGCTIYYGGVTPYTSTGTQSAWDVFAAANPTWRVAPQSDQVAFVILDEVGTVFLDRVAMQNHMFVAAGTGTAAIKHCPFESSC
jgi:hypothetical protein